MKCKYKWNYFNTDDCLFTYEMVAKEDFGVDDEA